MDNYGNKVNNYAHQLHRSPVVSILKKFCRKSFVDSPQSDEQDPHPVATTKESLHMNQLASPVTY